MNEPLNRSLYASLYTPTASYIPLSTTVPVVHNSSFALPYNPMSSHMGFDHFGQQFVGFQNNPWDNTKQYRNSINGSMSSLETSENSRRSINSVYINQEINNEHDLTDSTKFNSAPSPIPARYRGKPRTAKASEMPSLDKNIAGLLTSKREYATSTNSSRDSSTDTDSLQLSEISQYTNNTSSFEEEEKEEEKTDAHQGKGHLSPQTPTIKKELIHDSPERDEDITKNKMCEKPARPMLLGPGSHPLSPKKRAERFHRAKLNSRHQSQNEDHDRKIEGTENSSGAEKANHPPNQDAQIMDNESPSDLVFPSGALAISNSDEDTLSLTENHSSADDSCTINYESTSIKEKQKHSQADDSPQDVKNNTHSDSRVLSTFQDIQPPQIPTPTAKSKVAENSEKCFISPLNDSNASYNQHSNGEFLWRSSSINSLTTKLRGVFVKDTTAKSDDSTNNSMHSMVRSSSNKSLQSVMRSSNVLTRIRGSSQKHHIDDLDTPLPAKYLQSWNKTWIPGNSRKSFTVESSRRVSDGKVMGTNSNPKKDTGVSDLQAASVEDFACIADKQVSGELNFDGKQTPRNKKQSISEILPIEEAQPQVSRSSDYLAPPRSSMKKTVNKQRAQRSGALKKPCVSFSDTVQEYSVYSHEEYDRNNSEESNGKRTTAHILQYYPSFEYQVCKDLNAYKKTMDVHPSSRQNTHFMKVNLRNVSQTNVRTKHNHI